MVENKIEIYTALYLCVLFVTLYDNGNLSFGKIPDSSTEITYNKKQSFL